MVLQGYYFSDNSSRISYNLFMKFDVYTEDNKTYKDIWNTDTLTEEHTFSSLMQVQRTFWHNHKNPKQFYYSTVIYSVDQSV
jgi:hypothetical protein